MGRSQRHKVFVQGFASNDELYAQGQYAGMGDARNPPEHMITDDYKPVIAELVIDDIDNTDRTAVTVKGTGFYPGSMVSFDDDEVATEFISDTKVRARVQPKGGTDPRTVNVKVRNASLKSNTMPIEIGATGKPLPPLLTQTATGPAASNAVVGTCAQPGWDPAEGPFTYTLVADPDGVYKIVGTDIQTKKQVDDGDHFLTVTAGNALGTSAENGATFNFDGTP